MNCVWSDTLTEQGQYQCVTCGATMPAKYPPYDTRRLCRIEITEGPGTELQKAFATLGLASCQRCNATANKMNAMGVDWCRENVTLLVDEIEANAKAHKALAVRLAAKLPMRRAMLSRMIEAACNSSELFSSEL